jgi:hypothetical protein
MVVEKLEKKELSEISEKIAKKLPKSWMYSVRVHSLRKILPCLEKHVLAGG